MTASANREFLNTLGILKNRSSTPCPEDKVLMFLDQLSVPSEHELSDPDLLSPSFAHDARFEDGRESPGSPRTAGARSPTGALSPRHTQATARSSNGGAGLARSRASSRASGSRRPDERDVASTVQERGSMEVAYVDREPGPEDEPGPRNISYGSGPSFGNMGPLPRESSQFNGYYQQTGTPGQAAGIPLPASVASPRSNSLQINVQPPSSSTPASSAGRARSPAASARFVRSAVTVEDDSDGDTVTGTNHAGSRALGDGNGNGTVQGDPENIAGVAFPQSYLLLLRSNSVKSGSTQGGRVQTGGQYVPPSNSAGGGNSLVNAAETIMKSPRPSKAPSLSPSDSASQFMGKGKERPKSPHYRLDGIPEEPSLSPRGVGAGLGPHDVGSYQNGLGGGMSVHHHQGPGSPSGSQRVFSPHRHAATEADLFHAAMSAGNGGVASPTPSRGPPRLSVSVHGGSQASRRTRDDMPMSSRPTSPGGEMNDEDQRMVQDLLNKRMSRTSLGTSAIGTDVVGNTHFHDMELCELLHALKDPTQPDVVRKAVKKAVRQRIRNLGMKYDNESINQYRKSFHDHDPNVHLRPDFVPSFTQLEPPDWAKELMQKMMVMQQRIEGLGPKIESLKGSAKGESFVNDTGSYEQGPHYTASEMERYGQTPMTQTVNIQTQPTGTVDSVFQPPDTEFLGQSTIGQTLPGSMHRHDGSAAGEPYDYYDDDAHPEPYAQETETGPTLSEAARGDSPGQQYLEEELYKLRIKPTGSQSAASHRTWEVAREQGGDEYDDDADGRGAITESGMPDIPDAGTWTDRRRPTPPLPPVSAQDTGRAPSWGTDFGNELPPWQRIHQRLLSWAIVWPMSELDTALSSTTRGHQIDEVALSIWSTQTYKRYVRTKMTDSPQGNVDRLFVPPNMADAISNAVYNGRHGDACAMLRDLWAPFGFEGMPRFLLVLAKHRTDAHHWVVHKFSLPHGCLTTYDTHPEKCLPDGRPLGWWFAIRLAWPDAINLSPDHLMQKMVRLHRPMQLRIDNSVAAAGIWRNLLMGSRPERDVDLERLRGLIDTEVNNLRQRKERGKLSISGPRQNWDDVN